MSEVTSSSQFSTVSSLSSTLEQRKEPNAEALRFIESLSEEDFKGIVFSESLTTFSDFGKEVGQLSVSITETTHDDELCFRIHASSNGSIDGIPCGTSVTAFVSKQLETIEQQHHEYLKLSNHPIDKRTIISRQDEYCAIDLYIKQGEEVTKHSKRYPSNAVKGIMCEGSNLLLLRLLARKENLVDEITFPSFDSEINLCHTTYKMLNKQTEKIGGQSFEVLCIERMLLTSQDDVMTWRFFLTRSGHLAKRLQIGSPVVMIASQIPQNTETDEMHPRPAFPMQPLNWEEDMEMKSKYEDRKSELVADHETYLRAHPEICNLIRDYTQFILMRKPDDVLPFTADYFEAFGPQKEEKQGNL